MFVGARAVLLAALLPLLMANTQSPMTYDGESWRVVAESNGAQQQPTPPVNDAWAHADTLVYVNIAAFRDGARCGRTLFSLFTEAEHVARVRVGVVQQNAHGDEDCLAAYCRILRAERPISASGGGLRSGAPCSHSAQVAMKRIDYQQARGPVWARALGQTMRPEEADVAHSFCMQIDSHMLLARHWDTRLMATWADARNEMGILTTFPPALAELDKSVNDRCVAVRNDPIILPIKIHFRRSLPSRDWLAGWLAGWLVDWLADWLTG
jgi:hypothetical protein